MMKNLRKYIAQENSLVEFMVQFGSKREAFTTYDPENLTPENLKQLAESLAGALSPENLTCDGELRGAKLAAKSKMLYGAKADLESIGIQVPSF